MRLQLKARIRKWLGIEDEMADVWLCISKLQEITEPTQPAETGGVAVQASRRIDQYSPDQSGSNVVIAEPKLLSVERGKREM